MPEQLIPQTFVEKWQHTTLKERSAYQQHFLDLCALVKHATPAEMDHAGTFFTFEAGAKKVGGGDGFADVWYRGHFAWEYKGKHADLDKAYQQLLQYREALENPPLLIVSDIDTIVIHTNFTNTIKRKISLTLDDLLTTQGIETLRRVFTQPEAFQATETAEQVTEQAAVKFAQLAEILRQKGYETHAAAHFLIRLLFCLFAEDTALLPSRLFTNLALNFRNRAEGFTRQLNRLFEAMATGSEFGIDPILHFDGRLFDDAQALELGKDGIEILLAVGQLDWASIEPSIFGTLFERSLDPAKRSQLGAHYTSRDDILLIVEPVLMAPLRRKWAEVEAEARALAGQRDAESGRKRAGLQEKLSGLLVGFAQEIAAVTVLDPACGSGNFLYMALRQLLDLEKEVIHLAGELGVGTFFPSVSPAQLHGIEINETAHQLAQAAIQIGYIQWLRENGFGIPTEPILKPLDTIVNMDAILAYDEQGRAYEPEWPMADVIIGNPPFLGDKKMRAELEHTNLEAFRKLYKNRIPGQSDFVCYWFEKARGMIDAGIAKRAGLLATNSIRGGANRTVLDRITHTGNIFWAQSDRNWVLDGAAVRVSMIGFDNGDEKSIFLDDYQVNKINSDLTARINLPSAITLVENLNLAFIGTQKGGNFDIPWEQALAMLDLRENPNGKPNSDVIRPWINGLDITRGPQGMWIIDFGTDMSLEQACQYSTPFEYIKKNVESVRVKTNSEKRTAARWWLHQRPRPEMRIALTGLTRYIATARVAKYRLFVWIYSEVLADSQVVVIARSDDYFLGVLHSRVHELWSLKLGTSLEDRPRYTPTTTFETFPFPWPPGTEPQDDPRVQAIAQAARELVQYRDNWLNPPGLPEAELKKRTLTNLYNQRPTWLDNAHKKLDQAVFAAYGWPPDLTDEQILERLLALNLERAARQGIEGDEA